MIPEDQGKARSDVTRLVPIGKISTDPGGFLHPERGRPDCVRWLLGVLFPNVLLSSLPQLWGLCAQLRSEGIQPR